MRNKIEHILLSILLGLTILLGLSFWLNTIFSFNIFYKAHWDELSKLQAAQTSIATGFYVSFAVAIVLFATGLYLIYRQGIKNAYKEQQTNIIEKPIIQQTNENKEQKISEPVLDLNRPPRLNLPKNMAQIAKEKNDFSNNQIFNTETQSVNPYNSIISDIFTNAGYTVKPNTTISGFNTNLFAIGNNEIVWIGGVDCTKEQILNASQKLQSVFKETLEDIPITINTFILDTLDKYTAENDNLLIFKSVDKLKEFMSEHPADKIDDDDKENFDSYSEYIDTIIQYIKNL